MCLSDFRKVLFLVAMFLLPLETWAAEGTLAPVTVTISSEISVNSDSVNLGDVATIHASQESDLNALAALNISQFPTGQTEMQVPSSYLSHRIQDALPAGTEFKLEAPEQILLRLRRQAAAGISAEELSDAITKRARSENKIPEWVESTVDILSGVEALKSLRMADVQLEPAGQIAQWKGDIAFKVTNGGTVNWVRAKIRWYGHVWAATKNLGVSSPVSAADFEIARLDLTSVREEAIGATESLDTLLANARYRRQIRAHDPLVKAAIERKPDAKYGQTLKVVFISQSGIRVSADGSLLGAGSVGDEVRARLNSSRKIIVGRLVQPGLMEVSL